VISPFAKVNYVDHSVTDQASILQFIEDNWGLGRIGDNSADAYAGTLMNMFRFQNPTAKAVILDPNTGLAASSAGAPPRRRSPIPKADSRLGSRPSWMEACRVQWTAGR